MARFGNGFSRNRRSNFKRTRFSNNSKSNAIKLDKKFKKKIKKIDDMIELKWSDISPGIQTISTTGQVYSLPDLINALSAGENTLATAPIGAEVTATSVHIRGFVVSNSSEIQNPQEIRMILLWDRQPNGTVPPVVGAQTSSTLVPSILDTSEEPTNPVYAPYNYMQLERFKILYDKIFVFNPKVIQGTDITDGSVTDYMPVKHQFNKKFKLHRVIKAMGTGFAIANPPATNVATNNLLLAFVSNSTADEPSVRFYSRMYYKDA